MEKIRISDLSAISEAAGKFIEMIGDSKHVAFYAGMGSGKTTFITAICERLGVEDLVTSPTFTIVNEYRDRNGYNIYHFDFYRINRVEELYDIGFEEYVDSDALCLIEWPEMAEELLPEDTLKFRIESDTDGARTIIPME